MSVPDLVTITLGVVSPLVSLGGSYISWRIYQNQARDSRSQTRKTMEILAPSFLGDVRTARAALEQVRNDCASIPQVRMANSRQSVEVVQTLAKIRMPTVEKYKDDVVRFDPTVADPLLQALACLERVRNVVENLVSKDLSVASLNDAIAGIRTSIPNAIRLFEIAEDVLAMPSK
ncbi:hypothetical protein [Dyella acidiphila]|uniref:Uncharacterized protein n=1 Tax=Dyella acidiphila TaxID=2775866 RepID=A0ABR9GFT9_9GAMM|nr:hypothetical protein [Dyella acidiphila]MBE1162899.1 hypothetical protein [Dyella acidiphila]